MEAHRGRALRRGAVAVATLVAMVCASNAHADTIAPTTTVTNPAEGQSLVGPVHLSADAVDDVDVVMVKWYVDGVQVAFDSDGAPWSAAWDSARIADGVHRIFAKARDSAGNWGSSPVVSFSVDNPQQSADQTPPTVALSAPKGGQTVDGNTVPLAASAFDNVGVARVKWYVDGVEVATDSDGEPWARTWDSRKVSNGSHRLLAKARDAAGNWGSSVSIVVSVDNAAPAPGSTPTKGGGSPTRDAPVQGGPAPGPPDTSRPVASGFAFAPTVFRALTSGPTITSRRSGGTRIAYRLSESAVARFTVDRVTRGRRVGSRCARPTRANSAAPVCTRFVAVGSFTQKSRAHLNRLRFAGRLAGRRLVPGRYRMSLVATDAAGNRALPLARRFRIVR